MQGTSTASAPRHRERPEIASGFGWIAPHCGILTPPARHPPRLLGRFRQNARAIWHHRRQSPERLRLGTPPRLTQRPNPFACRRPPPPTLTFPPPPPHRPSFP